MLTGLGFVFSFLGIMFFFDRGLIALGNVRPRPHQHGPVCQLFLRGSLAVGLIRRVCVAADVFGGRVAHHWAPGDAALLYEEEEPEGADHSVWFTCRANSRIAEQRPCSRAPQQCTTAQALPEPADLGADTCCFYTLWASLDCSAPRACLASLHEH